MKIIDAHTHIFPDKRLEPNEHAVGSLVMHFDPACDIIIGVGSGVINDISKILANITKNTYVIVATAAYMDGYAAGSSSMALNGVKVTVKAKAPEIIVGDLDVLCGAPIHMAKAGLGDMLAKYVSICEWRLANLIINEYYCEDVAQYTRDSLRACVETAPGLLRREDEALEAIAEEALARNTGARGLRAIMEQFMMKLMYELPSDELADTVTITRAFIKGEADAVVTHRALALPEATEQSLALPEASAEEL